MPAPDFGQPSHADRASPDSARTLRAEFIAITGEDMLLEQIGQALDGESTIRHAETCAEAQHLLTRSQPRVLLLDARGHENLSAVLQALQSPNGTNVIVVLAPAESSAQVAVDIRGSAAFAVLPIPLEQAQAAAVIAGARDEALARHVLATAETTASAKAPVTPATASAPAALPAAMEVRPPASPLPLPLA
jgi:DNA-binding NtrC family response regulator